MAFMGLADVDCARTSEDEAAMNAEMASRTSDKKRTIKLAYSHPPPRQPKPWAALFL